MLLWQADVSANCYCTKKRGAVLASPNSPPREKKLRVHQATPADSLILQLETQKIPAFLTKLSRWVDFSITCCFSLFDKNIQLAISSSVLPHPMQTFSLGAYLHIPTHGDATSTPCSNSEDLAAGITMDQISQTPAEHANCCAPSTLSVFSLKSSQLIVGTFALSS